MSHQASILPIAQRGEPILHQPAQAVEDINQDDIQNLMDDMHATMLAANGVGIAAPQVFSPLRIIIVASRPSKRYPDAPLMEPVTMVNPEILWKSADSCTDWEGCLSVPDARAQVPRASRVKIRYLNREGRTIEAEYNGFVARIIQHEYDHLEGILFPERVEGSEAEYQQASASA
jgi:peptide deformylase